MQDYAAKIKKSITINVDYQPYSKSLKFLSEV